MKKVLIVAASWGFVAKFELFNIRKLQKMGYEIHLAANRTNVCYNFPPDVYEQNGMIYHNIDICQSPFAFAGTLRAIKQIREILHRYDIDILHCHMPTGGLCARLAARRQRAYVIYTAHSFHFYKGGPALTNFIFFNAEKLLSKWTDAIITVNKEDLEAVDRFKRKLKKYCVPGVGLDTEYFGGADTKDYYRVRKSFGIGDEFVLTNVALLTKNKNQKVLLQAMQILIKQGFDAGKLRLYLVGNGEEESALKREVQRLGLTRNVVFCGYQEDVRPYLIMADAFVFPSIREGFGMAGVEALAMGVPLIASDNGGTKEYMKDGVNGCLCTSNTAEEYAVLLKNMYDSRSQWSRNAEKRLEIRKDAMQFDRRITAQIIEKVYEDASD